MRSWMGICEYNHCSDRKRSNWRFRACNEHLQVIRFNLLAKSIFSSQSPTIIYMYELSLAFQLPLKHPTKALEKHTIHPLDPGYQHLHLFIFWFLPNSQSCLHTNPKCHLVRNTGGLDCSSILASKLHLPTSLSRPDILSRESSSGTQCTIPRPEPGK